MCKSLFLSLFLLLSALWLQAQTYPQSSSAGGSGGMQVQGCLSGSSGNYTLTADNGTTYMLTGNTAELKDHVGHEVQITGNSAASNALSTSSASSTSGTSAGGGQTLEVTSMKHIAKDCKSAAK